MRFKFCIASMAHYSEDEVSAPIVQTQAADGT